MEKRLFIVLLLPVAVFAVLIGIAMAADSVPTDVQMPGTQPGEVGNLESVDKCDNCHGGYNAAVEPSHNWQGSMMANAGRDPLFWATLAVAEQDFDGVGDMCLRCHSPSGWIGGRSTPTDGSALAAGDADGVECDLCHSITNPDDSEWVGVQNPPFVANDGGDPAVGHYGTGMYSLWAGADKLGPYSDAEARHQFLQSEFHRSEDFCGTCHDVSNPVTGDLAHNNGAQVPLEDGTFSGMLGSPVEDKAAFNNLPYQYGVVERTYSEYMAGLLSSTLVSDYAGLPDDLQAGALQAAYESAIAAGTGGDYADGTDRTFSCQTCHMSPVEGPGCNKNGVAERTDLPLHDMTGGNYWTPDAILHLDGLDGLRLGGGLTDEQVSALNDGKSRAIEQLGAAASLTVEDNTLKIVNLTGHKLITGYPEGRRMWLDVKWYDGAGGLVREDGKYGPVTVNIDGEPTEVDTLIDLEDPNTKVYEAQYGMTQEWARQLLDLGYSPSLVLSYDRITGEPSYTLGELANSGEGDSHETFHFALNNIVVKDNRIPPYGMSYSEAQDRNELPVPADQYGDPDPDGTYNYWDKVTLNPPAIAVRADISLVYQSTSWEYIQFLWLANNGSDAFLANEGEHLLETWLNTGMAEPYVMASGTWTATPQLMVSVAPQGTSRPDPTGWEIPVTIRFYEAGTPNLKYTFACVTEKSGAVAVANVSGIAPDSYDITVVSNTTLTNIKYDVTISGTTDPVHVGTLLEGDANGDGIINISDFGILAVAFMSTPSDPNWDARADFDRNGIINISDFGLLAVNFMKTSPVEVP